VRFKSLDFLTKKSIDLNRDWNQWLKSHWFKSANPVWVFAITGLFQALISLLMQYWRNDHRPQ